MKYLKLFEDLKDHPLLDFFQDIGDEYDLKLSTNHYRVSIQISNVSKVKNTNPDILQIMSIMDSELIEFHRLNSARNKWTLNSMKGKYSQSEIDRVINDFDYGCTLSPQIQKIPLIQRIEEMTDYKFHRCSENGFLSKRETFNLSILFVEKSWSL